MLASFVQFSEAIFFTILGGVGRELDRAVDEVPGGKKESLVVEEQSDSVVLICVNTMGYTVST